MGSPCKNSEPSEELTWLQLRQDHRFRPIIFDGYDKEGSRTVARFRDADTNAPGRFYTTQVRRWVMDDNNFPVANPWPRDLESGDYLGLDDPCLSTIRRDEDVKE